MQGIFSDVKSRPFWLFFMAIFSLLMLSEITSIGMFFDGITYAVIARNMAEGIGSFFNPIYVGNQFPQHPMLMCWLESWFFKILGDHFYVEKIFSVFTSFLSFFAIIKIWNIVFYKEKNDTYKKIVWLPLFLFILTPVIYWTYRNNMLENMLIFWGLLAVFFNLKATFNKQKPYLFLLLGSISILLGLFTKGPVALFPLAIPFLYWIVYRDTKLFTIIKYSLFQLSSLLISLFYIFKYPPANWFIKQYYYEQLVRNMLTKKGVVIHFYERFDILKSLFFNYLPTMIVIAVIIYWVGRNKKIKIETKSYKNFIFFFLIGMSASFPIMLSSSQSGYYNIPSIPYYALAFACLVASIVKYFYEHLDIKSNGFIIFKNVSIVLLIGGLIYPCFRVGKICRDHSLLDDIYSVAPYMPTHTAISVSSENTQDWAMHAYMYRIFYNNVAGQSSENKYFFLKKGEAPLNKDVIKLNIPTKNYDFYIPKTRGKNE